MGMQMSDSALSSEQKLLWHRWREKSRRVDLLVKKRMTFLFSAVAVGLLGCILHYALRAKASFDPNQQQPVAMYQYSSTPIVWRHLQHGDNLERDGARQL